MCRRAAKHQHWKICSGAWVVMYLPLLLMNRLNKTESDHLLSYSVWFSCFQRIPLSERIGLIPTCRHLRQRWCTTRHEPFIRGIQVFAHLCVGLYLYEQHNCIWWTRCDCVHQSFTPCRDQGCGEQGKGGIYFRETIEQRSKTEGKRGTKALLGKGEHGKSWFWFGGNRRAERFISAGKVNRYPTCRASYHALLEIFKSRRLIDATVSIVLHCVPCVVTLLVLSLDKSYTTSLSE